jgi:hypothetical protein
VIVEVSKGGLGSHRFDPCNSPPTATYLFLYTMVSIVGPLYKYIIRACSVPAMKCGHQSATICDLGNLTLALGALNVEKEYLPKYFISIDVASSCSFRTWGFGCLDAEGLNFYEWANGQITELFQRSMVLVDLISMVHNYFRSSGFEPFQCIAPTILQSVISLK